MDEVQSWWEVPTVALFCNAFRSAFNLLYMDIAELEAAILNIQDPEMCISLEQLAIRILQGCYEDGDVTFQNWEDKLQELFDDTFDETENPLKNDSFSFMTPRCKVEVLIKLCECRIDTDGVLDAIKDIPSETMQAKCVGKDSQNNTYWYFCDERLYKEDLSISTGKSRKRDVQGNTKSSKVPAFKNGKRSSTRERKTLPVEYPWSIECYNVSDWEALSKKFSKSKHAAEKELAKQIRDKYIPLLQEVVAEKDRFLRKRFLELQPKRSSSRISKVQAQRKLEEQIAADAAEEQRLKTEAEDAKKEAKKKQEEKDSRRKRAEEREKKIAERFIRAQKRDMMSGRAYCNNVTKSELSSINENEDSSSSEDENSSSNESEKDSGSEGESENNASSRTFFNSSANITNSISVNGSRDRNYIQPFIQKSYDLTKWNSQMDHKGHKIHVLSTYEGKKQMGSNDVSGYSVRRESKICYKENNRYQPFRQRNLNSCTKVTPSPSVIRLDFIKPSPNHQLSKKAQ